MSRLGMRSSRYLAVFGAFVLTAPLLEACNKAELKVDKTKISATAEPIPSDFVVNPFIPEDRKVAIQVKGDAGPLDPALSGSPAANGQAAQPGAESGAEAGEATLLSAGEGTKKELRYALSVGKSEARTATVTLTQDGPRGGGTPPFRFALSLTPVSKKANGNFLIDVKTTKIDIVATNEQEKALIAQAAAMLSAAVGIGFTIELTPLGAPTGELKPILPAGKGAAAAQQLLPVLQQVIGVLYPRFPKEAVAPGAKWQISQKQDATTVSQTFTLKSFEGSAGVLTGELAIKSAKQPVDDPRAPPGTTVSVKGTGTFEWQFATDHAAAKATVDNTTTQVMESGGKTQSAGQHVSIAITSGAN